jgi:hypothetical protein
MGKTKNLSKDCKNIVLNPPSLALARKTKSHLSIKPSSRLPACNGQNHQEFSFFRSVGFRRTFTVYNSIHRTVRYASSLACSFNQIRGDLVFLAKAKDGDYHQEMNGPIFLNWFENQLMPALKSPSVIVLDNTSYYSIKTEETVVPNFNQRKAVLQDYFPSNEKLYCFLQQTLKPVPK